MTDQSAQEQAQQTEQPEDEVLNMTQEELIESLTRRVTAPLEPASIREFFENKNLFYLINHSKSKIKGPQFLIFASNLELPCDIEFDLPLAYDEYAMVMHAFMNQTSITRMSLIHVMACQILLTAKGIPVEEQPYNTPANEGMIKKFIEENEELVVRWLHFFDSTPVFAISAIERLRDHYKPEKHFEVIEDRLIVGPNVAMLYDVPEFIGLYFTTGQYRMSYYKTQFEEYIFKGKRLVSYYDVKNNLAAILFTHFAAGAFSASEVENEMFKIGVFDPKMGLPEYKFDPLYSVNAPDDNKPEQDAAVQDGQSVVNETTASEPVSSQPESGTTEGV